MAAVQGHSIFGEPGVLLTLRDTSHSVHTSCPPTDRGALAREPESARIGRWYEGDEEGVGAQLLPARPRSKEMNV